MPVPGFEGEERLGGPLVWESVVMDDFGEWVKTLCAVGPGWVVRVMAGEVAVVQVDCGQLLQMREPVVRQVLGL